MIKTIVLLFAILLLIGGSSARNETVAVRFDNGLLVHFNVTQPDYKLCNEDESGYTALDGVEVSIDKSHILVYSTDPANEWRVYVGVYIFPITEYEFGKSRLDLGKAIYIFNDTATNKIIEVHILKDSFDRYNHQPKSIDRASIYIEKGDAIPSYDKPPYDLDAQREALYNTSPKNIVYYMQNECIGKYCNR